MSMFQELEYNVDIEKGEVEFNFQYYLQMK